MLIAQLSDTHLRVGPLAGDAAGQLHRALGRVLGLRPVPDCVVVTGDVADTGAPEEYEAFRSVVAGFPIPIHLAAGNHDSAAAMVEAFAGTPFLGGGSASSYVVDYPSARLIVLDSSVPGALGGTLDDGQLAWLDRTLGKRSEVPALVCLHHPPIAVGIAFLDGIGLTNPESLQPIVAAHPNIRRILAGHVHRTITGSFAGVPVTIAPSTYRQAVLALDTEEPTGYAHEPPGFLLHLVTGGDCVTHLVPTVLSGDVVGHF
ncbi:MAG TPA: phosphodiesterase [Jatrophihabitans sp.]|nr:phosphodiesterase [Jatrophihabitans sp.]